MARIELRDCTIYIKDGLSGTGCLSANASANTNTINIDTVVTNASVNTIVPVGARFTIAGEDGTPVHTVQTTNTTANVTDYVTFTPNTTTGNYNSGNGEGTITFLPCQIDIKIGEGNLTWSEKKEYVYLLDRGDLDTVKEGNEVPVELSMEFVYEHVTTGTSEDITPSDAIKAAGLAADWVSSATDLCEPYCVDIVVVHDVPCGTTQDETLTFADFRFESLDYDLSAATIAVSGKCNVSTVNAVRS
jgi:hypothetical protein